MIRMRGELGGIVMEPMLSPMSMNPFTLIADTFRKVGLAPDFEYEPSDAREEFWDKECEHHPTMPYCRIFDE